MADLRAVTEFSAGEITYEQISFWMQLPVTQEFRRRLLLRFDHQNALLGSTPGSSVDRLIGRAEVINVINDPMQLFEE